MNILIISHFFPPHIGGVETASYNTAKHLANRGHNVIVLTSKYKKSLPKYQEMDGFLINRQKSYHLPEIKYIPQSSSFGIIPQAIYKLTRIIKKHQIHIIHAEGRLFPITVFTALFNNLIYKRRMFITAQGRLEIGITGFFEKIFDLIITKPIYQKIKQIICVSNSIKNRLLSFGIKSEKLMVIPNGVDISSFNPNKSSQFLDNFVINKQNFKKVIFVGRLDPQKGVEFLIRAIPYVLNEYTNVHFFVLGNGNLELKLKNLVRILKIQSFVTFINMIPLEKMVDFYASADVFCLPSLHEGFPLSVAEALSMGLIIVASATEGIPEAIIENKNGFLTKRGNVNSLVKKLLKALTLSDEKVKEIHDRNINLAKNKYSWEIIIDQIEKLYYK
ncbi:MAG: glycosyltransferase family 4 protein [Candidatus Odinarchaeota archaeon]